jgi:hypothetical protein
MINFRINKYNFKMNVTNELGLSDVILSQISEGSRSVEVIET